MFVQHGLNIGGRRVISNYGGCWAIGLGGFSGWFAAVAQAEEQE